MKVSLKAIKKEKARAWKELFQSLEEDPWGRPYKIVLNKLRPWAPLLTESLDPGFVREVIDTLSPERGRGSKTMSGPTISRSGRRSSRRPHGQKHRPDIDGLHKKVLALVLRVLVEPVNQ